MEKSILIKIAAAIITAAVAVTGIVLVVRNIAQKDTYRSILIYELEGTADIEREGTGNISAVEQLYLESGDRISVAADSSMRLKLDDDKYIMVEENSILSIEAVGTKADSKTKIQLVQGAITNEIQNPLSADSTYEVTTPNAVMAVRGTIFRVEVYFDADGKVYTKLTTFEGKVTSRLIFPDGTLDDEVSVEEGNEVIIYSNTELTDYLRGPEAIKFEELPLQSLYTLKELIENNAVIVGINKERLEELIRELEEESGVEEEVVKEEPETEEETDSTQEEEIETEEEQSPKDRKEQEAGTSGGQPVGGIPQPGGLPESGEVPAVGGLPQPGGTQQSGETPSTEESPSEEASTEEESESTEEDKSYTVKFLYQGQVFGTQTVKHGKQASRPTLSPAAAGEWDFDFSTAIKKDTEIEWKP